MNRCDYIKICPFLSEKIVNMPRTSCNLVETYCHKDFVMCEIHKAAMTHGIDKVPQHVTPEDKCEISAKVTQLGLW